MRCIDSVVTDDTTIMDLQARHAEMGMPHLRVWWAPGIGLYCATFGIGVPADKLHGQAEIEAFARKLGLDATVTAQYGDDDCVGRGETMSLAIMAAEIKFIKRYGDRIFGAKR